MNLAQQRAVADLAYERGSSRQREAQERRDSVFVRDELQEQLGSQGGFVGGVLRSQRRGVDGGSANLAAAYVATDLAPIAQALLGHLAQVGNAIPRDDVG